MSQLKHNFGEHSHILIEGPTDVLLCDDHFESHQLCPKYFQWSSALSHVTLDEEDRMIPMDGDSDEDKDNDGAGAGGNRTAFVERLLKLAVLNSEKVTEEDRYVLHRLASHEGVMVFWMDLSLKDCAQRLKLYNRCGDKVIRRSEWNIHKKALKMNVELATWSWVGEDALILDFPCSIRFSFIIPDPFVTFCKNFAHIIDENQYEINHDCKHCEPGDESIEDKTPENSDLEKCEHGLHKLNLDGSEEEKVMLDGDSSFTIAIRDVPVPSED